MPMAAWCCCPWLSVCQWERLHAWPLCWTHKKSPFSAMVWRSICLPGWEWWHWMKAWTTTSKCPQHCWIGWRFWYGSSKARWTKRPTTGRPKTSLLQGSCCRGSACLMMQFKLYVAQLWRWVCTHCARQFLPSGWHAARRRLMAYWK